MSQAPSPAPGAQTGSSAINAPARKRRRWPWVLAALLLILLIAAEFTLRHFGLGDPPLFQTDPQIGYLMAPSHTYVRFGRTISYNAFSMRGRDFPKEKAAPREFRILVLGDSVVNGGPFTADEQLATTLLQSQIAGSTGHPTTVANISAGGWCPGNELAYIKKFGLFGADALILVLNNDDAFDVLNFDPMPPERPTSKPLLALQEFLFRYVPSAIGYYITGPSTPVAPPPPPPANIETSMAAIREIVALARAQNVRVAAVLHWTRPEVEANEPKPGLKSIRQNLRELKVPIIETAEGFRNAMRAGADPYKDDIHPSAAAGQQVLAQSLQSAAVAAASQ